MFMGIAIIADIFMSAIEVITSQEVRQQRRDPQTGEMREVKLVVWNPTVANLTLMALGSSAPEIILSVIETIGTLDSTRYEDTDYKIACGDVDYDVSNLADVDACNAQMFQQPPSDGLGAFTIVGSAAFNLLVITAACVVAVPKGEKRYVFDEVLVVFVRVFVSRLPVCLSFCFSRNAK
jgi:solute carrier family 8 (sodium/calcium exchanger)